MARIVKVYGKKVEFTEQEWRQIEAVAGFWQVLGFSRQTAIRKAIRDYMYINKKE